MLTHHELRFHKISNKDGSAKCDIFETGKQTQIVIGVVFDIAESEKPLLDKAEGLGNGYETKDVAVELHNSIIVEAYTYYATHIDPSLRPFHWYKQHVLAGAFEHGLPEDYVRAIHAIESIDDPDDTRHQNELAIYL
jgi:hypothetical protein